MRIRIKKDVLEKIAANPGLRGRLCAETDRPYPTIQRWVAYNHELLTLAASLKVIREELKLTDKEILEEIKQTA